MDKKLIFSIKDMNLFYGDFHALKNINMDIYKGDVTAFIGPSGCGKSTFIKILSGNLAPDGGVITVGGRRYARLTPKQSQAAGISTVYQDLSLDDYRDVAANIFLGHELTYGGIFLRKKKMREIAAELIERLDIGIPDITLPVGSFSGGQRQAVAVARAVYHGRRIVIFDEPTAAMGVRESAAVLRLIGGLAARGMAVVIICHNMHQVFDAADTVSVMRRGRLLRTVRTAETSLEDVQDMIMEADYVD